jgi:AraC family transcriptional regulator, arabinose operon regulatory protein
MALAAMSMHDPAIGVSAPLSDTPAPPPGLLVADFFSQGATYRSRRRMGTRDWLITFTVAGRGLYRLAGKEFGCESGDVMLLQPGAPHDYGTDSQIGRWDFYWAHFLPRPTWNPWLLWRELAGGLRGVAVGETSIRRRIEQVFARLLRDVSTLGPWGERLAENALEEVILLVGEENARSSGEIADPRVAQVVQEISRRYREPTTVAELAEHVHLSPSRLAHLFKDAVGESPIQMLLRLRLRQAARLLEYSTLSVAEIAAEVGFDSQFYFARQFREQFATSPTGYRRARQRSYEAV